MRISDWSSDVCSSDLSRTGLVARVSDSRQWRNTEQSRRCRVAKSGVHAKWRERAGEANRLQPGPWCGDKPGRRGGRCGDIAAYSRLLRDKLRHLLRPRSEEHTSELQSLMRISYAGFCL